ncbi:hypothetical protein ABZT26_35135 [Streptomyces sp. NPDC005395]|uniref:hypothetical protein n=1 Tax=Streptomyces sp. NPDC005395 TaxID=3157042 RepID=UPI0033B35A54
MTRVGPEGIVVGDVFRDGADRRWHFTGHNDVADEPFALDRDGWPVLASELIRHHEWRHRRPAHPMTAVEIRERLQLGDVIGIAQGWPRERDGWADTFEVFDIDTGLRKVWLVHTGRYLFETARQVYSPGHWRPKWLVPVHAAHVGALARLTLWFEGHQADFYKHRDKEGRWL